MTETSENSQKKDVLQYQVKSIGLIIIILGLVTGVFLVQRVQEVRRRAAVPEGPASVFLEPETGFYGVGDTIQAKVYFNTGGLAMNGIAVRLTYPFTTTGPEVMPVSIDINPEIFTSGDWNCPTKSWFQDATEYIIDIACVNANVFGYTTNGNTLLATVNLNVGNEPRDGSFTLRFYPNDTIMTEKATGEDILSIPTSTATYTFAQSSGPKLYFYPSEINATTNSTGLIYDIYLDTAGYEVNGAVFEVNFDTEVIRVTDIVEAETLRLVIDKSVEGGKAYLAVVLADETKPFVGVAKAATVIFETYSTETTTYFTFDKNTQIHTKTVPGNILNKARKGTIHIGLPITPTPTQEPTPTPPQCSYCETMYGRVYTCQFPDPETGTVSYGRCNSDKRVVECEGNFYCCNTGYWSDDLAYCGGPPITPSPTVIPSVSPTPTPYLIITTDAFSEVFEGDPYTDKLLAEARNYSYDPQLSITATNLPPGISIPTEFCTTEVTPVGSYPSLIIKSIECIVEGNPAEDGLYNVSVTLADDLGSSVNKIIPLMVNSKIPTPANGCVIGFLPGDGNGDCTVDGLDYGIWFVNYNQNVTGGAADGDYDLNGFVDGLDYAVWFINYGKIVTPP